MNQGATSSTAALIMTGQLGAPVPPRLGVLGLW
jgi:hypothetical protein